MAEKRKKKSSRPVQKADNIVLDSQVGTDHGADEMSSIISSSTTDFNDKCSSSEIISLPNQFERVQLNCKAEETLGNDQKTKTLKKKKIVTTINKYDPNNKEIREIERLLFPGLEYRENVVDGKLLVGKEGKTSVIDLQKKEVIKSLFRDDGKKQKVVDGSIVDEVRESTERQKDDKKNLSRFDFYIQNFSTEDASDNVNNFYKYSTENNQNYSDFNNILDNIENFSCDVGEKICNNNNEIKIKECLNERGKLSESAWNDSDDENILVDVSLKKYKQIYNTSDSSQKSETLITGINYGERLKNLHQKLSFQNANKFSNKTASLASNVFWVENAYKRAIKEQKITESGIVDFEDDETLFLRTTGDIIENSRDDVAGRAKIVRLPDANISDYSRCSIRAMQFHPTKNILLVGGYDKTLRLFDVNGHKNKLLESLYIKDFLIEDAKFTPEGDEIFIIGKKKSFAVYDLTSGTLSRISGICDRPCDRRYFKVCMGKRVSSKFQRSKDLFALSTFDGYVLLCDLRCRTSLVRSLKMNSDFTGMAFHPHLDKMITTDKEAFVYEWDLRHEKCINKFFDEGSLKISAMNLTNCHPNHLITGSTVGYLGFFNAAENKEIMGRESGDKIYSCKPFKSFSNLTTSIGGICCDKSDDFLCYYSYWKKNAVRLVHLPTLTVIPNWPRNNTDNLKRLTVADFSNRKNYFALGNADGKISLYEIKRKKSDSK